MKYKHIGEISDWRIDDWEWAYWPLNVCQELLKMEQWLEANPNRRKKNYLRFCTNWLSKAQAHIVMAQTTARVQAKAGEQTGRVGCWVDGRLEE